MRDDMEALRSIIRGYSYFYYTVDVPIVTDEHFDAIWKMLQRLEERYPELITPDSPTQLVGENIWFREAR